jgi:hypothetical protein
MKMVLDNKKTLDKIQLVVKRDLQIALENALKTIQSKINLNIDKTKTSYITRCTTSYKLDVKLAVTIRKKILKISLVKPQSLRI